MHTLILGMTESGKSTLTKMMVRELTNAKRKVVVYDPLGDQWEAEITTRNPGEFSDILKRERECFAFVDEAGTLFEDDEDMRWIVTRGRHWGHSVFLMSQRGAEQIPKLARDQCGALYLFTSSASDGRIHADEWNDERLAECNTLPQFHFMKAGRFVRNGEQDKVKRYVIQNPYTDRATIVPCNDPGTDVHSSLDAKGKRRVARAPKHRS